MNIFILDTSTDFCSASIFSKDKTYTINKSVPKEHNKHILNFFDDLLIKAGLNRVDLDILSYGLGPGSFVGVRISSAVMQAISLVLGKPVLGFSSLYAIAKHAHVISKQSLITVILDAKSSKFYLAQYKFNNQEGKNIIHDSCVSLRDLYRIISEKPTGYVVGDKADLIDSRFKNRIYFPDTQLLSFEIEKMYKKRSKVGSNSYHFDFPIYLNGTTNWDHS